MAVPPAFNNPSPAVYSRRARQALATRRLGGGRRWSEESRYAPSYLPTQVHDEQGEPVGCAVDLLDGLRTLRCFSVGFTLVRVSDGVVLARDSPVVPLRQAIALHAAIAERRAIPSADET